MFTNIEFSPSSDADAARIARVRIGLQCPECFGVNIQTRETRFDAQPIGWQCQDCGCQWTRDKPVVSPNYR
jgi:transposase-like protein